MLAQQQDRRSEMKQNILLSLLVILGLALVSGCATMHTWPDQERNTENQINVIQGKIGEGLKTRALSTEQSQTFLTTLQSIQTDYAALRNKDVYREKWDTLQTRLNSLEKDVDHALVRTTRIVEPGSGDRIITLQKKIDDERASGRLPTAEGREFQTRLDSIRSDYLRMSEGGRSLTNEERGEISRRLESLERELNQFR
jgi:septal ring factor EnvC (AmiA/AmiB activator)